MGQQRTEPISGHRCERGAEVGSGRKGALLAGKNLTHPVWAFGQCEHELK